MVSALAEEILSESGFADPSKAKAVLDQKRADASQVRSLMKAFVLATITSYTAEDLDNLTYPKLAEKVALSEKIIEIKQAILGIESTNVSLKLIDPQEESKSKANVDPIAEKLLGRR